MKIKATIGRKDAICGPETCFYTYGHDIPSGTKVTIEWDENEHWCNNMQGRGTTIRRSHRHNGWDLKMDSGEGQSRIFWCPYCRCDLEECK